ncbi:aminotransferase class IV family protein [Shinella sp. BYT-45]|uniref:aminotransferase class IV family protein n=1 Tax=Shinella sp. BYT-45 TaxID=3377377 RepID=UPI0039810DB5
MDLSLIETLRWEPATGFVRLERHLARLAGSAVDLGVPGAEKARDALFAALPSSALPGRAEEGEPRPAPLRIRLELFADGRIEVQTAPFTPLPPEATWRLKIAATRLSSADPLLRHKTSRRAVYAAARAEHPAAEADEMILLNERGEVCEGTITSLFLDDGSGILKTPPLSSGLLAGVLREELLETGKAVEKALRPEDLARGTILMGNSLRGLIRSELA